MQLEAAGRVNMGEDTNNTANTTAPAEPTSDASFPTNIGAAPPTDPVANPVPDATVGTNAAPVQDDELLSIKQEALQHITPLIDHLDQTSRRKIPYHHDDDSKRRQ